MQAMAYASQAQEYATDHVSPAAILKAFIKRRTATFFQLWKGTTTVPTRELKECKMRCAAALARPGVKRAARDGIMEWKQQARVARHKDCFLKQKRNDKLLQAIHAACVLACACVALRVSCWCCRRTAWLFPWSCSI